jgi:serine/threonine protein phosphatase PrpC
MRKEAAVTTIPGGIAAAAETDQLSWALLSHQGCHRDGNEDFVGAFAPTDPDERGPLFVVADGMGGHAAGEVASRMAVETVFQSWTAGALSAPHQMLRNAVRGANSTVFSASLDHDRRGMGTTLTALTLAGTESIVAHVGDSRAYMVRGRDCSQLTSDHSRVGEMLRMRLITPEQAANHPARSQLTRSLGAAPAVQVDVVRTQLVTGDGFVLCSDGLWDLVSRPEIAEAVAAAPAEAADTLIGAALERGAPDNVTVLVVKVLAEMPASSAARPRSRLSFLRWGRD